jgi:hypothetical protein
VAASSIKIVLQFGLLKNIKKKEVQLQIAGVYIMKEQLEF